MATFQVPLINRLVGRLPVKAPADEDAYAAILREMSRFSAASIVDAALRILWAKYPSKFDELQMAPWHILLLVKWALKSERVVLRAAPAITPEAFDGLRQRVHDLLGMEHRRNPPENLFLMLRAHLQQVEFQKPPGWGFLRWPALIARQPSSYPSHRQATEMLGMPVPHFIDLSYAMFAAVLGEQLPLLPTWFEPLRAAYGASIDAFLALISRDLPALRQELRREPQRRLPARQELYEFPYLKRFPMVRLRDGRIHCWHPLVFARGLEDLVHLRLSQLQSDYTQPFSRLFEQHVVELSKAMDPAAVSDEQYRARMGANAQNVEAAISCGDCNILVEAKMSLFADDVLLTDSEVQMHQKTKRLREGIKQAWHVGKEVRAAGSALAGFGTAEQDFLLLVTSRELFIGDGEMLKRLFRSGEFDYPDEAAKANLPLRNVFILSVDSFERLSCAVAAGAVSLSGLLKEAAAKAGNPAEASILFDGYLQSHVKAWGTPELLLAARTQSERRLALALGHESFASDLDEVSEGEAFDRK